MFKNISKNVNKFTNEFTTKFKNLFKTCFGVKEKQEHGIYIRPYVLHEFDDDSDFFKYQP